MRRERCIVAALALAATLSTGRAQAVVLAEDEIEESSTELGVAARSFGFVFFGDVMAPPYNIVDQDPTARGVFDARLYFGHRTPNFKLVVHDQLTLEMTSHASIGPLSFGRGSSPPRWLPLTFEHDEPTLSLRSDADWIYGAYTIDSVTITLGRQPITFGRGTLWRTTDRVSTFSLTEIDTEYKPGADALRIDIAAGEQTNITAVGVVGELESESRDLEAELRASSFVAQLKQGWDGGEFGVVGGFVRYDAMLGVDTVLDFGDFDIYGELTATLLTDDSLTTPAVDDRDIPVFSAHAGATFRPTGSLTLGPEVLYNGFGAWDPADYFAVALSERVGIGEQVALGQLYLGYSSNYEMHPLWNLFHAMIVNPRDPSGLVSLGVNHNLAGNAELVVGGYIPVGRKPSLVPFEARSEYGVYPYFVFTELKGTI